jgi:hypothetical protein
MRHTLDKKKLEMGGSFYNTNSIIENTKKLLILYTGGGYITLL